MKRKTLLALATVAAVLAALLAASISTAAPTSAASFALYAGKTTPVGTVYVWNDATNLYVEIDMDSGWCMTESHVAVASTVAGIPQNSQHNPTPGQFAYGDTYNPCEAGGDTFTIPLAGLDSTPVIAVHAKVLHETSMWIYSDDGNTSVTATSALPAGKSLPFASTDAWEAFGDPVDPTPSVWDSGVGVATFQHADWIWQSYRVQTPAVDETVTFTRAFTVPGSIAPGSWMKVTTDDAFTAMLNGATVATGTWPNWPTVQTASPFAPLPGANTLVFVATNSDDSYGAAGTIDTNPGGLIYEAQVNYYDRSESAWAGSAVGETQFNPSKSWATYFTYTLQDVLLETVTVPATAPLGASSTTTLANGTSYLFKVTGTVTWLNRGGYDIVDAECSASGGGPWVAAVAGYPDELLELQVNSLDRNWTPVGAANAEGCAASNEYTLPFTGLGSTVNFRIYDGEGGVQNPGWFGDNSGSLTVQIWLNL